MTYSLFIYGNTQFLTITDAAQASAGVLRDNNGNINAAGFASGVLGLVNLTGPEYVGGETTKTSGPYTVLASDALIPYDTTSAGFAINLPAVAANTGRILTFVNVGTSTNAATLTGNGSENVNGANTLALTTSRGYCRIWCDGTAWYRIG